MDNQKIQNKPPVPDSITRILSIDREEGKPWKSDCEKATIFLINKTNNNKIKKR